MPSRILAVFCFFPSPLFFLINCSQHVNALTRVLLHISASGTVVGGLDRSAESYTTPARPGLEPRVGIRNTCYDETDNDDNDDKGKAAAEMGKQTLTGLHQAR